MAKTLAKDLKVSLLQSSGKVIWQTTFATDFQTDWQEKVNLTTIPAGLYFLQIENAKGKSVKKLIIER
jgi:hypothetical protein